jgi:hypothetical protein
VEIFAGGAKATTERVLAGARDSLGPSAYDALWWSIEAMSYDESVAYVLAALDDAIAEANHSA